MKVRDIMRTEVTSVTPRDELALAAQIMLWNAIRHLPVVEGERLVGMLSERDILAQRSPGSPRLVGQVADAMTPDPQTITPQADVEDAAASLAIHKHGSLPVADGDRLVGMITTTDLLAEMAQIPLEEPTPTGALLERTVESIMTSQVAAMFEDDSVVDAAARMRRYGIRHLPVVDGLRRVVGILSERDLLATAGNLRDLVDEPQVHATATRVQDVMVRDPRTVRRDDTVADVVGVLAQERFGALPVVDEEDVLQGMVSYLDVLLSLRHVG